jgi:hypothetical protein
MEDGKTFTKFIRVSKKYHESRDFQETIWLNRI